MKATDLAIAILSVAMLLSCGAAEDVTRRRGEWVQDGRRVSPLAYAWYARGTHHEREGEYSKAASDYRAALDHDPESGSAWAALGRVLCQTGDRDAHKIFERGLKAAERLAPVYFERGSCRLLQARGEKHRVLAACADFAESIRLEPHAPRPSSRYSDCLRQAGEFQDAKRYDRAARLYYGSSAETAPEPTLRDVDHALLSGDLERAQNLSLELMSPGALATRAVLLGQSHLARQQADLVRLASPDDVDATLALLALGAPLPSSTNTLRGLSAPGLVLLFKVLKRKANSEVAHEFLNQHREELRRAQDPLVAEALTESTYAP